MASVAAIGGASRVHKSSGNTDHSRRLLTRIRTPPRGRGSNQMEEEGEASPRAPDEYGGDIDGNRKQGHPLPSRGGADRLVGAQPLRKTDVDQSQLALRSARSTPRFMIDPRYSKFSQYWDLVTMFALLFTAIVTPYEVSFLEAPFTFILAPIQY